MIMQSDCKESNKYEILSRPSEDELSLCKCYGNKMNEYVCVRPNRMLIYYCLGIVVEASRVEPIFLGVCTILVRVRPFSLWFSKICFVNVKLQTVYIQVFVVEENEFK
jgi:hypothetical protein